MKKLAYEKALFTSKIIKIISVSADYLQAAWELYQKYKRPEGRGLVSDKPEGNGLASFGQSHSQSQDKSFSFTDVTSFVITRKSPSAITLSDFRSGIGKCFILSCTMKNLGIRKAFAFDREFIQAGIELIE